MLFGSSREEFIDDRNIAPVGPVFPELIEQQKAERFKALGKFAVNSANNIVALSISTGIIHAASEFIGIDPTLTRSALSAAGGFLINESAIGIYQTIKG